MLGFVLVTGAALTARTLSKIDAVHPGFEPRQLLTFQLAVASAFRNPTDLVDWEAQLAALPGVERAGAATHLPLDNDLPNLVRAVSSRRHDRGSGRGSGSRPAAGDARLPPRNRSTPDRRAL